MDKVTVYQWQGYDIQNDVVHKSQRWATKEAAKEHGGAVIDGTAIDVDAAVVGKEVPGMTERGFNPHSQLSPGGFQAKVKWP